MSQIQIADPTARKRAMLILLVVFIIGAVVINSYTRYETEIFHWFEENMEWLGDNPVIVFLSGLVLVAPLLMLSGYLFIYGRRAAETGRMPPPNYAVTRDTTIKTGKQAVIHGRLVQLLSLFLLLVSAAIPILFWYLFDRLI